MNLFIQLGLGQSVIFSELVRRSPNYQTALGVHHMIARYIRLYADESGESHFADVAEELKAVDFAPPAPLVNLSSFFTASRIAFFSAPADWQSDWHCTATRNLFVVISGEWEITASDGETKRFSKGSVLIVEDTKGKGHTSRVVGSEDSLAVLVQMG